MKKTIVLLVVALFSKLSFAEGWTPAQASELRRLAQSFSEMRSCVGESKQRLQELIQRLDEQTPPSDPTSPYGQRIEEGYYRRVYTWNPQGIYRLENTWDRYYQWEPQRQLLGNTSGGSQGYRPR